jgi:hypothetical protein
MMRDLKLPKEISPELRTFAEAVSDCLFHGGLLTRPPQDGIIHADGVTGIVVYRAGPLQIELVIVGPMVSIPVHAHPDVESIEMGFSGGIDLFVEQEQRAFARTPRADGTSRNLGRCVYVPANAMHSGYANESGASFLSIQRWLNGVAPGFIRRNWRE